MPSGTAKIIDTGTTHWVNRKDYVKKADLSKIVEELKELKEPVHYHGCRCNFCEWYRAWTTKVEKLLEG